MRFRLSCLLLPFTLAFGAVGPVLMAQVDRLPTRVEPRLEAPAAVPFGPGELLRYDVRLGALGRRGEGHMQVIGLETVRGRTTYHVSMAIEGGLLFAKVKDHYDSWFDVTDLVTRRFIQDVDEINYERYRHWELFPEERRWERPDNGNEGDLPTDLPLDDISFLYFVRTLPLEVGDEYSFDRYFRENGNPVVIRVLRKDTVTVPAGTFETVVVRPIIQTKGLFSQGGEAELYFTTDERRLMVLMKSKVPLVGALSLHLTEIRAGSPLQPLPGSMGTPLEPIDDAGVSLATETPGRGGSGPD
ncbi:MAG: DUF3108 domain-containing protein [Gemmatimonadota bacterium]|jgi:hypothetical protein